MFDFNEGSRALKNEDGKIIGIQWWFTDGSHKKIFFDTEEEWLTAYEENIRKEHAQTRKEKYHCCRYDLFEYEGLEFADDYTAKDYINLQEESAFVDEFLMTLTPLQRRRLKYRIEDLDISLSEIARRENVDHTTIRDTFDSIKKKLEIFIDAHNLYWLRRKISS